MAMSNRDEDLMCGGTKKHEDPNAPKVINSKTIVDLDVHCRHRNIWSGLVEPVVFSVRRETENGPLILTRGDLKVETDTSFLAKIQEIIDEFGLVKINGYYEYTDGILPEFNNYIITALYDSSERLHFDTKGTPESKWCAAMRKALCDELVRHDITDMLPPEEDRKLRRFTLEYNEWPLHTDYTTIRTQDDEDGKPTMHFLKGIWNSETKETEYRKIIRIPEGFYDRITELVEETDLRSFSNGQIDFPSSPFPGAMIMGNGFGTMFGTQPAEEIDRKRTPFIHYCAEGESGKQFNAFYYGDKIPEGLMEAAAVIREYLDGVFS